MGKIFWKSLLSVCLIWQSLLIEQSRADSKSFLNLHLLQETQTKDKLKTHTQSFMIYLGNFGLGYTDLKIINETDSFKYELNDRSIDLGFYLTSSITIGAGAFGSKTDAKATEILSDKIWTSKRNSGQSLFAHYGFNFGFLDFLIGLRSLRYSFEDFEQASAGSTTTLSKPISGYSNLILNFIFRLS